MRYYISHMANKAVNSERLSELDNLENEVYNDLGNLELKGKISREKRTEAQHLINFYINEKRRRMIAPKMCNCNEFSCKTRFECRQTFNENERQCIDCIEYQSCGSCKRFNYAIRCEVSEVRYGE